MPTRKRFLNIYTITAALALLLALSCYFTVRKVMGSDIELGMSKAELIQRIGAPNYLTGLIPDSILGWERIVFSEKIYRQVIFVTVNESNKVVHAGIYNRICGYKLERTIP